MFTSTGMPKNCEVIEIAGVPTSFGSCAPKLPKHVSVPIIRVKDTLMREEKFV